MLMQVELQLEPSGFERPLVPVINYRDLFPSKSLTHATVPGRSTSMLLPASLEQGRCSGESA